MKEWADAFFGFIYLILATATGMIGHAIHGSVEWAIVDFCLAPLAWVKWLIYQEVSLSIIKGRLHSS